MAGWSEICARCGRRYDLAAGAWICRCGGLLDLVGPLGDGSAPSLPLGAGVTAGPTPVVEHDGVHLKIELGQPTGSFKDRGAAAMIGMAAHLGVRAVVTDSSGNAGRAVAASAARVGIECRVYVPETTAPAKVASIEAFGAEVRRAPGREAAAGMARTAAESGVWYASHVYQPVFHHGVKTMAFELSQQVPRLDTVVVPAGNGTLVLGLWLGFRALVQLGRVPRLPRIVAVQADRCAPLAGRRVAAGETAAAGIAIRRPPRAAQIRAAVAASGGSILVVTEEQIMAARADLAAMGYAVDPAGAVARAVITDRSFGRVVAVLSG